VLGIIDQRDQLSIMMGSQNLVDPVADAVVSTSGQVQIPTTKNIDKRKPASIMHIHTVAIHIQLLKAPPAKVSMAA
jgi:hypothetical protein